MISKSDLRNQLIQMRNQLSEDEVKIKSKRIIERIRESGDYKRASIVGIYYPFNNEIDLLRLLEDDKKFAFPKIINKEMNFYLGNDLISFQENKFGILEPTKGKIVNEEIDLLICPAIGITKTGYRLGFGGGYYDKFLSKYNPKKTVAVIYDFQEIKFMNEIHDKKVDYYIKE